MTEALTLHFLIDENVERFDRSDRVRSRTTFSIRGVSRSKPRGGNFQYFGVSKEVFDAPECFIVWVRYKTSDTYGADEGKYQIVDCFKEELEAKTVCDQIYDETYQESNLWDSWGASLESCDYEHFRIKL